ncbi:chorismate-binding protein [Corynebacterium propinquum]|uniref:chorismate-binding protein n=1 Tax=Corynebacterium propinquum TaxID=43769 RepID=UPI000667FE84|nr:chorismate-binding protein [Corynebacterium propinquum]MDK4251201.1 chorismate-binding protein [Corynebacterium propinquum]MDK4257077.1 chorismate-binding protein [Corynebacterium propinquum]MDK4281340.1 chorismate-binding protein [Corynebacterium propinquum]MDK4291624.1 chorismate-binding protein [Corynebacterium propinquum]MDK4298114.1 chorismate-binding protein [Corynebacterium propinquum]
MKVVLVDNHDSFTNNLASYVRMAGQEVVVIANDADLGGLDFAAFVRQAGFGAVIISPGPGTPENPSDLGHSAAALHVGLPVLGVCLGQQAMAWVEGGSVVGAPEPFHGRRSRITHDGTGLFSGIDVDYQAVRYHSLVVADDVNNPVPDCFRVTARTADADKLVMGLEHKHKPWWGVQFHPESIADAHGMGIVRNFLQLAARDSFPGGSAGCESTGCERTYFDDVRCDTDTDTDRDTECADFAESNEHGIKPWLISRAFPAEALATDPMRAYEHLHGQRWWIEDGSGALCMGDDSGPLARHIKASVARGEVEISRLGDAGEQESPALHRESVFATIERLMQHYSAVQPPVPGCEFSLGLVGYLGYELKADCGYSAPHAREDFWDAQLLLADRALILVDGQCHVVALCENAETAAVQQAWVDAMVAGLQEAQVFKTADAGVSVPGPEHSLATEQQGAPQGVAQQLHSRAEYLDLIAQSQELIAAGESYEICLTNRLTMPAAGHHPKDAFAYLRANHASPRAGLLEFADFGLASTSPECFVRIAGGVVTSKPIKGTRPRGASDVEDTALRESLQKAEKDRAENLMIVDLVRHDMNAVAVPGSVEVPKLWDVESFPSVHQLVSTVSARLGAVSPVAAVRALFPAGSMTGAPKKRTLDIIDRLEGSHRGAYSGAFGYFSFHGAVDLSMTIRTLIFEGRQVTYGVGGAIVSLSDPEDEYTETQVKARPLFGWLRT